MKTIALSELTKNSGEIFRQIEAGQQFTIALDGRPVAVLGPYQKIRWVPKEDFLKILRSQLHDSQFFYDVGDMGGVLGERKDRCRVDEVKTDMKLVS